MPKPMRIGAVRYLNSKPLIYRLQELAPWAELRLDVPSRLADQLASGDLDVALIPSIEYFRGQDYAIVPGMAVETAPGEVVLRAAADGHFYAHAVVDGVPVRFLVDTGASSIALSAADARRLGIDPEGLHYFLPVTTANGSALAARVTLGEVRLGSIAFENVTAAVMPPGALDRSLLGMSFLDRLGGFEISGDRLILRR